jgi:hypothetical protein
MTQEVIIVTNALAIDRALGAGVPIDAASDIPAEGPQDAMLTVEWYDAAHPDVKYGGTGVEIVGTTKDAGVHHITVTPAQLPFAGTIKIG